MILVEPILHRAYGGHGVFNVLVVREHDECRIFALALWRWRGDAVRDGDSWCGGHGEECWRTSFARDDRTAAVPSEW